MKPIEITQEIQEANNRFMAAYESQDPIKVATEIFSDEAMVFPPGSPPVKGGTEILTGFWSAVMASGIHRADIQTTQATAYGDMAIDIGTLKLYDAEGTLLDDAKYLVEWQKENGQWKIKKDIWNSNQ